MFKFAYFYSSRKDFSNSKSNTNREQPELYCQSTCINDVCIQIDNIILFFVFHKLLSQKIFNFNHGEK